MNAEEAHKHSAERWREHCKNAETWERRWFWLAMASIAVNVLWIVPEVLSLAAEVMR